MTAPALPHRVRERIRWGVSGALGALPAPRRAGVLAAVLLLPPLLLRLFTSVTPFVETLRLSFTDASPLNDTITGVGLENYEAVLTGPVTVQALVFTVAYTLISTALELVVGFALALLMDRPFRYRNVVRGVALVPWAIPAIVTALGFRFMFSDGFGIIPHLLGSVGVDIAWLTDPFAARASVIIANVWRTVPFIALIILAGLQGIPDELLQAARVDGASYPRLLRSIVLPLVMPLLITMGIFMFIFQLGSFDIILGMTGGGPGTATNVLAYEAYQEAFIGLQYGRSSAIAMLLFVVVLVFGLLALRLFRRYEVDL